VSLAAVYVALGEESFRGQLRGVSIGRLRTYQLFDRVKARLRLGKLNTESLRKAAPRLWERLSAGDEDLAADLAQAILVSNLDLIRAVLDYLGVPHNDGFFDKDAAVKDHLAEGWQQRAWDEFRAKVPSDVLLFYLNHLGWEVDKSAAVFRPASAS
jgi:hypothetical protein